MKVKSSYLNEIRTFAMYQFESSQNGHHLDYAEYEQFHKNKFYQLLFGWMQFCVRGFEKFFSSY